MLTPERKDFPQPSRPAPELTQPLVQWVLGLSQGYSGWGMALTHIPCSTEVKERVQLYIYPPSVHSWHLIG